MKLSIQDVTRAREAGVDKLLKKLFPMSDTLDICIANKPNFDVAPHKDNAHAKTAFDGIIAAKAQMVSILLEAGIEEVVPAVGDTVCFIFRLLKNFKLF